MLCREVFETRGIGCTVLLLTKVCTLAFKISELLGNYTCYMGCVVYILTSGLSTFLLAPKSGVSSV